MIYPFKGFNEGLMVNLVLFMFSYCTMPVVKNPSK